MRRALLAGWPLRASAPRGGTSSSVSLVVADGRITRIYAIRNPHKLARPDEEATRSR
jgi:hypothetical protein